MIRTGTSFLLFLMLLIPLSGEGQVRDGARNPGATPQEARVFLETFQAIRDYSLSTPSDSLLWEKAIEGLIRELNDPYAVVLSAAEVRQFEEETTGNYAGIGVQITELNQAVTITAVFRNTPAEEAGLLVGDRIVGVDSDPATGWTVADASSRIRGEIGTRVQVLIQRDGIPDPIPHEMERREVHVSSVIADVIFDDVGYIHLDRFARGSAAEVDSALTLLRDTRGIILDFRRNPGGFFDESLNLTDLFLEPGSVLATTRSRAPETTETQDQSGYGRTQPRLPGKPIIVLVDRFTASAAEIVAGALQDYDRALLLGERTFGKGLIQQVLPLSEGRQVRLTTGEWFTPLGRSLHRPRDREGRLMEEQKDSFPLFYSQRGRELKGGGGVHPDLEVELDTIRASERDLLTAAASADILINLRIAEVSFASAQRAMTNGAGTATLTEEAFDAFLGALVAEGLPPEVLNDEAREFLRWRIRIGMHQRMDAEGKATEVRSERDPALAEAVRLVREARTLNDLFTLAGSEPAAPARTGEQSSLR